jgi:hypothetical protein
MSVLLVDEALAANVGTELSGTALQDAIDREEAWLARRIGPLTGERTERFPLVHLRPGSHEVRLRRPTDAVEVLQDGVDITTSCELRHDGWRVALLPEGEHFAAPLEVTYTPNDELEVQGALLELLSLRLGTTTGGGLQQEIMGSYSYTRAAGSATRIRHSLVRNLLEPASAGSSRLHSSVPHGLAGRVGR